MFWRNFCKEKSNVVWLEYVGGCHGGSIIEIGSWLKVIIQEQAPTSYSGICQEYSLFVNDWCDDTSFHLLGDTQQLIPLILT